MKILIFIISIFEKVQYPFQMNGKARFCYIRYVAFLCKLRCGNCEIQYLQKFLDAMMVMMMRMNCFYGMVVRRKAFSRISNRDHCQRSSPSWISGTPRAGFESAQSLSLGLVKWSCAEVITSIPRCHVWTAKLTSAKFSTHKI